MVQGKYQKINYKVKKFREVDEADWIRVEGTHEPIISREVFDIVQEAMSRDTRVAPGRAYVYPLSGYVRCADCGQNMIKRMVKSHGHKYHYYFCSSYAKGEGCTSHNISDTKLAKIVLASIRIQTNLLIDTEEFVKIYQAKHREKLEVRAISSQIKTQQEEIQRYKELLIKLYNDKADGIVEAGEYKNIESRFREKIRSCESALEELNKRRSIVLTHEISDRPWMKLFRKYENEDSLTRQMVVSLIDDIIVYDKNHIEVHFRFEDEMNDFLEHYGWQKAKRPELEALSE